MNTTMWVRFFSLLYGGVVISVLVWMATTYGHLPREIPMQFDENFMPTRMTSGHVAFRFYVLLILFQGIFFGASSFAIRWMPVSLINLPNREYWLTEPRRGPTLRWLTSFLLIVGTAMQLFMATLYLLSLQIGRGVKNDLYPEFLWAMGLFLTIVFGGVIYMLIRFGRIPADAADDQSSNRSAEAYSQAPH